MSRVCVFCGSSKNISREHIFSDWLSQKFAKGTKGNNEVRGDDLSRNWQGSIFQDKIKIVCEKCNNGWMSDIETRASKLLSPLIFEHRPASYSRDEQAIIALWVQKTVLVISKTIGGAFQIPKEFYSQLYNSRTVPLDNMMVHIGWRLEFGGMKHTEQPISSFEIKQVTRAEVNRLSVNKIKDQINDGKMIWAASLAIGYVVFNIFGSNLDGNVQVGNSDDRIFVCIHPYLSDFDWPTEWPINAVGGLIGVRKGLYGD